MSALSHGVRIKFVEFFKSLLRWPPASRTRQLESAEAEPADAQAADAAESSQFAAAASGVPGNGDGLALPLQPILGLLPLELRGRIKHADVGEMTVSVPLASVLSQLTSGAVRITFGQVRRAAPQVFAGGPERDQ